MKTNWDKTIQQMFFYLVGITFLLGFFGIVMYLIMRTIPQENREYVGGALETLKNGAILILGYFYGSAKGSADKDRVIAGMKAETPLPQIPQIPQIPQEPQEPQTTKP